MRWTADPLPPDPSPFGPSFERRRPSIAAPSPPPNLRGGSMFPLPIALSTLSSDPLCLRHSIPCSMILILLRYSRDFINGSLGILRDRNPRLFHPLKSIMHFPQSRQINPFTSSFSASV